MKDLAIMYHYIRERGGWSGIHPLPPEKFEKQLEEITKYYDIVAPDDLNKKGIKPKCVLTFDDATKDQYNVAFDLLNKKGIPGYFTVMSGPIANGEIPIFHLVHTILSIYSDEEIWSELNTEFELKDIDSKSSYYQYEKDLLRRYNKYTLNFYLNENQSRKFLEERVISQYGTKQKFIDEFYISKDEFVKMNKVGMTIGVHCVNHRPYNGKPWDFYSNEVEPCVQFIRQELQINPVWYTPAFGGGEKYKEMIVELEPILRDKGFRGGFTTIEGQNEGLSSFWLNRFDCVKIPPITNFDMINFINN